MKYITQNQQDTSEKEIKIYDQSECDTIERCPHDKENPYVQINVNVLRDESISPECRWLIAYLLTNKDGWRIKRSQVINHLKGIKGRDSVNKIFDEALEAGYLKKVEIRIKNPRGGLLKSFKYHLSETPKFKKFLRMTENQATGDQTDGRADSKYNKRKEKTTKKEYLKESIEENVHNSTPSEIRSASPIPASPSPTEGSTPLHKEDILEQLSSPELLELLALEPQYLSYFRPNIVSRWILKFGARMVLETIKFFFYIKSTQKKPIPKPEAWMESAFIKKYAEVEKTTQANKTFAENLKKKYGLRNLKINKRYCMDTETGKDYYYYLPENVFKENLTKLY